MCCSYANAVDYMPSISDFGGAGLLQTPTARMFEDGEVAISYNRTLPYSHANLTFTPLSWLEANIRYTNIANRDYGKSISSQDFKDKSIDFKFSLRDEDYYWPQLALGFKDIGGTGLFSSEFLVASKRFNNIDITLGIGWGYLALGNHSKNPLSYVLGDKFNYRNNNNQMHTLGGTVNSTSLFHGSMQMFGGIEYQTPWQPLVLKVEYDGNDYQNEPRENSFTHHSPINLGLTYSINSVITLQAAIERGDTAMLGFTLHNNFGRSKPFPKLSDPQPTPLRASSIENPNWKNISQEIEKNAAFHVSSIRKKNKEIVITGSRDKYFSNAKSVGRVSRIVINNTSNDIKWITVTNEKKGIKTKETSISRKAFVNYVNNDDDINSIQRTLTETNPSHENGNVLYQEDNKSHFAYGGGIGYKQSLGGPDSFILYQFTADGNADYFFTSNTWASGGISIALLDNYDKFVYDAPSNLPRVRTNIRQYLTSSNVMLPFFQLTHTAQLSDNIYGMSYGGLLETMYGGVGGEVLYRPMGENYAFGMDINWVKQRAFEQDFNFRPYETITGHITHYWDTHYHGILLTTSIGRYLAKDYGITFDISRRFTNGVTMGGFATKTNVSAAQFGEGSFDKGIYITIPFDLLLTTSTLYTATLNWHPLTRDGGAKLSRKYGLYYLTEERNLNKFHEGLPQIKE